MAGQVQDCVETLSLGLQSNLEQLEGPWLELMAIGDPELAATALRLFSSHLTWTLDQLRITMEVTEAEKALGHIDSVTTAPLL